MTNPVIPTEAARAAVKAAKESFGGEAPRGMRAAIRAALEAAAPIILSYDADRSRMVNVPTGAVQAAHAAICEQNLDDCMDPDWRGKCVKAVEAAAPYMSSLSAAEIEAVEVMIKTAKANGWNEGYAAGMDLQVPEPCA